MLGTCDRCKKGAEVCELPADEHTQETEKVCHVCWLKEMRQRQVYNNVVEQRLQLNIQRWPGDLTP
jgi:hypothetical protein